MRSHPGDEALLLARKTYLFVHGAEIPRDTDIYAARSGVIAALLAPRPIDLPDSLLVPLGLVGIVALWRERRRLAAPLWLLATIAVTTIVFFVSSRHRAPALPLFALFAAAGAFRVAQWPRRSRSIALAATVALAVVTNIPTWETSLSFAGEADFYRGLAASDPASARAAFTRATELAPDDPRAWFELGNRLEGRDAVAAWQHAAELDPNDPNARRRMVETLARLGDLDGAIAALRASPTLHAPDHMNLAFMLAQRGRTDEGDRRAPRGARRRRQLRARSRARPGRRRARESSDRAGVRRGTRGTMNLRRAFVVVWIVLAIAGALAHTVAERAVGHTIDLGLPNLQYGYVMFNANPRRVPVYTYARADGERHDLADLDPRPAFGYKRARVATRRDVLGDLPARPVQPRADLARRRDHDLHRRLSGRRRPRKAGDVVDGSAAVAIAKLFAPFEGTRDPRPLAIVRIAFFSGLLLHFAPSLIWLDVGYGRGAVRVDAWNHWLFAHLSHTPPALVRVLAILTLLALVAAIVGIRPRIAAIVGGLGCYAFASFNSIHLQTLALVPAWAILMLWMICGGGANAFAPRANRRARAEPTR